VRLRKRRILLYASHIARRQRGILERQEPHPMLLAISALCLRNLSRIPEGAFAALLQDAAFIISNCTGVAHVAAALKIPGIVISMDGEPERWKHSYHIVTDWTKNAHLDSILLDTAALVDRVKREWQPAADLSHD